MHCILPDFVLAVVGSLAILLRYVGRFSQTSNPYFGNGLVVTWACSATSKL